MSQIAFMGLIVNKHVVGPTEEKVKAIWKPEAPSNVAELQNFVGLESFLPDFTTSVEPLRKLTHQGTERQWGQEENESFKALKNQLAEALMIAFYDKEALIEVVTDASPVGLRIILM